MRLIDHLDSLLCASQISPLRLSNAFNDLVMQQPFYASQKLIDTFLACQVLFPSTAIRTACPYLERGGGGGFRPQYTEVTIMSLRNGLVVDLGVASYNSPTTLDIVGGLRSGSPLIPPLDPFLSPSSPISSPSTHPMLACGLRTTAARCVARTWRWVLLSLDRRGTAINAWLVLHRCAPIPPIPFAASVHIFELL